MHKKLMTALTASMLVAASMLATSASAQNLYMNDLRLKADIDWLNTQGVTQISTSTWPLTANEIERGLLGAQLSTPVQQQVVRSIQTRLKQDRESLVKATGELSLQTARDQLPQRFGDDKLAGQQLSGSIALSEANWEFNLQANLKNDQLIDDGDDDSADISFEGSYIAGTAANQWLIAGKIPAWWGPGHDGSLIRGDASIPVTGFTMQRDQQTAPNYKYLNWVGPWQYQLFAGQLDDYSAVPDAKLFGARLTASPLEWLEVGASRSFMWGGEGRPEDFSSFIDAVKGSQDNGGRDGGDPANQLGGFDAKLKLASLVNVPASVYAQYVGEDEAGGLPAKNMYLAGADYASSIQGIPYQLYAEYTDTRSSGEVRGISYDHVNYTDGYYQQGYPLGYALGGDAESVAVGGRLWFDERNFIHAKLQHAKVNQADEAINQAYPATDKLTAIDVAWEHQLQPLTKITSRVWAVDSEQRASDIGAGIGIELATY
ncbi:capsule assembly Wzi family protein [Psychrobacter sp. 1Y11]|uniref:capsule assembly Wzi family protein n=1 Tax=Psychrobacter sp. 1Y11 TaxID=3457446 RepID=UPI003FD20ADB